jgi:hypothetical protein
MKETISDILSKYLRHIPTDIPDKISKIPNNILSGLAKIPYHDPTNKNIENPFKV